MIGDAPLRTRLLTFAGLSVLLLLAWVCYAPGLSGGFLFDDFVNLDALGKRGPIDNWPAFWRYITSGTADPLGRPLSLLTFLLDGRNWPADPKPFLRTNVLLHLLNGMLLFGLLRHLGQVTGTSPLSNAAAALLAAGLWLLHPLLVSTTLYVVQRQAMLPATFILAALWLYFLARARFVHSQGREGHVGMLVALGLGGMLAALSKANGILLPLLALVLVKTVYSSSPSFPALRRLERWLLLIPSLLLLAYVLKFLPYLHDDLATRDWTIAQRLLTQPRVLSEYLWLLVVPHAMSTGLYNDGFAVSSSWLQPASTLPALLCVLSLLAIGWASRHRHPRLAAGLLFFFAGHLLESTSVPLELYFEHRNYLPAMLLFWPGACAVVEWRRRLRWRATVASLLLLLLAIVTWQRAALWGQPDLLTRAWAVRNPESPRARATSALMLIQDGDPERAAELILPLWMKKPEEVQLAFNYVNARCAAANPRLSATEEAAVTKTLSLARHGQSMIYQWLQQALAVADSGNCPGLTLATAEQWIEAAAGNSMLSTPAMRGQDIEPLLGELAVYQGRPEIAFQHFRAALASFPNPDFAARLITFLAIHEHYLAALRLLDDFESMPRILPAFGMPKIHAFVLKRQEFWEHEFAVLRDKLEAEIAAQARSAAEPAPAQEQ